MKAQDPPLIENLGNQFLYTNKLREAVSSHQTSMYDTLESLTKKLYFLKKVIDMKNNVFMTHKIL